MDQPRIADQNDIAPVDALLRRSYPRLLAADYAPQMMARALPKIARAQPALVTCGTYYVIEDAGALIGAGGWTFTAPGSGEITAGTGHIRHVVTDHRQTRRGVGRALLTHTFAQAKQQGLHQMTCISTLTAVPFYKAMGFATQQPVLIPLGPDIDFPAVQMTRLL